MRNEQELIEEQERLWLCLQTIESKIQHFPRIYADDEYELAELVGKRHELTGRYEAIKWVRAK